MPRVKECHITSFSALILRGLVLVLLPAHAGFAQLVSTRSWNEAAGGAYSDPLNWLPQNVPNTTSEAASFGLDATYNVSLATDYTVDELSLPRGNVTLAFAERPLPNPRWRYATRLMR